MTNIQNYIDSLRVLSDERYDNFKIVEVDSISAILDKAYLEKPTWLGGDKQYVCLFIDLDSSSKRSFKKQPKTMARLYDYFTQNIVDVLSHPDFAADYIDIKGDGAFGIFEGEKASFRALYAAITFKTMFETVIRGKFSKEGDEELSCKFGIHKDKILVRRIGKRGEGNYNEVWAGRLVNNAAKLASQTKNLETDLFGQLPILVSDVVYKDFKQNPQYGFLHCCQGETPLQENKMMWHEFNDFSDETLGDKFYFTRVRWCDNHADDYIALLKN